MTPHPAWRTSGDAATTARTDVGPWRTSRYSGNGENCVEVAPWRTSSYTGNGINCVEVAPAAAGVLLRDSKDHGTGPILTFTAAQWTAFLRETATGAPSRNGVVTVTHTDAGTRIRAADGTVLRFTPGEWTAFRNGTLDGEFDTLAVA
jgi:hypothetical protein